MDLKSSKPAYLHHVLRYARTRELSNPSTMENSHVIEETQLIPKEEDHHSKQSFTIISFLKSLAEPYTSRWNGNGVGPVIERGIDDEIDGSLPLMKYRTMRPNTKPNGYFTFSNGVVKFIPSSDSTAAQRPMSYMNTAAESSNFNSRNKSLTPVARRGDSVPIVVNEQKHKDGFFTVEKGLVQFHPSVAKETTIEPVTPSSGQQHRLQKISGTTLSTLLVPPTWSRAETTSNGEQMETEKISASAPHSSTNRLPSARLNDGASFLPSNQSNNGRNIFNRISIWDYIRENQRNTNLKKTQQTIGKAWDQNILMAQMETLYPGFRVIFSSLTYN